MAFLRPTLAALQEALNDEIESRLPEADPRARRSLLGVLARAVAGGLHGLYGHQSFLARQLFADTAETRYLERHAALWGLARTPATHAGGPLRFTGAEGAAVPLDALLKSAGGEDYVTEGSAFIEDGAALVTVRAARAGAAGNAAAGTKLTLVSPLAGIAATVTVEAAGLTGGAEAESDEGLRARLLARLREAPRGGTAADYEAWALAVPGVTRVWVAPRESGLGTVTLRFAMDGTYADGIPQAGDVAALQTALEAAAPVTAQVIVAAPIPAPLQVTLADLDPDTPEVRAAIEAELAAFIRREAEPGGSLRVSRLREAISLATGEEDHRLVSPVADVTAATGVLPVFGGLVVT